MKAMFLSNWMVNSHTDGSPGNTADAEYEELHHFIFSHAAKFGLGKYVDSELEGTGKFYENRKFEDESSVYGIIDEYMELSFWDELINRLAVRDFDKQYSREQRRAMTNIERSEKIYDNVLSWEEEIDENGLKNIVINNQMKNK
jgi:hypothetical protein